MASIWIRSLLMLAASMSFPVVALAQNQCAIPQSLPAVRAIFPPPGEKIIAPVTGHTLALSWSPQFCKVHGNEKNNAYQCGGSARFGFILHGLWPDGEGRTHPQWCKNVPPISREVLRANFCATPSPTLMQHEWAKHGSCIESDAGRYFRAANRLYTALKFPDMNALSRAQPDIAVFTAAFIAANPGLRSDMVRVDVSLTGWLEAVLLCLGKDYHPRACPRDIGGGQPGTKIKIWRINRP